MFFRAFVFVFFICLIVPGGLSLAAPARTASPAPVVEADDDDAPEMPATAPKRIVRPAVVIDPVTLRAEGATLHLWGVQAARTIETQIELKAVDALERLIGRENIDCKIMIWSVTEPVVRCTARTNEDLGLFLLQNGYAVVNRAQTYNTVFASAYLEAQDSARLARRGIWKIVADSNQESFIPKWLEPYMSTFALIGIIFGPLIGLLTTGFLMKRSLTRILDHQVEEFEAGRKKDRALLVRERLVLNSLLEGELLENQSRIDAFLVVYRDMLRDLNNPEEVPQYQQTGELIHRHPSLSRAIFEANMNKLSLLDLKIAGEISKLYAGVHSDPEYVTLEPSTPLADAVAHIEAAIAEAEELQKKIAHVTALFRAMAAKQIDTVMSAAAA